jgi:RecB family exonuclease
VSFPRGDLRRSSARLPSRWLLPSMRALSGEPALAATRWESVKGSWLANSPSYAVSLTSTDTLASEQEWRTRAAVAERGTGMDVGQGLHADPVVSRALEMTRARASDALTRFDGDVSGHDVPDPTAADQVLSPTALELWTGCPHAYFLQRLLRVEPVESPEELVQISPLEIGNVVHETLDRFFKQQSRAGAVPGGAEPWTGQQRAELGEIAIAVAAEFERRGVTGHPLLWRQERARILIDLNALLDDDEQVRRVTGRQQVSSELFFGMQGVAPVAVSLPDGRVIRFRGSADRIDRVGDANLVVDYKTGSARKFRRLGEANPTADGTKLQLPVYAHAVSAVLGASEAEASAENCFLRKDRGKRIRVPLTPQVEVRYTATLAVIADGIAGGLFPHRPLKDDSFSGFIECPYCDPDGLGVKDHRDRWQRKRRDPRLAAYLALVEPDATVKEVR